MRPINGHPKTLSCAAAVKGLSLSCSRLQGASAWQQETLSQSLALFLFCQRGANTPECRREAAARWGVFLSLFYGGGG